MATILRRRKHAVRRVPLPSPAQRSKPAAPSPPISAVVRPEVLRVIAGAAGAAPGRETGGPLVGTLQPSWDTTGERLIVSILATVPPSPILRAGAAHVGLGRGGVGERAASALRWWRAVTGLDLRHLGDWHKHHSGMPEPSAGDVATAQRMRSDSDSPVWLTAVTVGAVRRHEEAKTHDDAVRFSRSWQADQQVRLYLATARGVEPVRVRVEADAIPRLPDLPWHITDPVRFAAECRFLLEAGFEIAIEPVGAPSPGVAFRLQRNGFGALVVTTGSQYPSRPPVVVDERGRRMLLADWSPARFLVDVVGSR